MGLVMAQALESRKSGRAPEGYREYHFAVNNYVDYFIDESNPERRVRLALLSKEPDQEGVRRAFSIGGGAELSLMGKRILKRRGVRFTKEAGERHAHRDARLDINVPIADEQNVAHSIQEYFLENTWVLKQEERDLFRELREELGASRLPSGKLNKDGRDILSPGELRRLKIHRTTTLSPREWKEAYTKGARARKERGVITRQIYNMHNIVLPTEILNKLIASEKIHVITEEDKAALRAACQRGEGVARVVRNGRIIELGTNLYLTGDCA